MEMLTNVNQMVTQLDATDGIANQMRTVMAPLDTYIADFLGYESDFATQLVDVRNLTEPWGSGFAYSLIGRSVCDVLSLRDNRHDSLHVPGDLGHSYILSLRCNYWPMRCLPTPLLDALRDPRARSSARRRADLADCGYPDECMLDH